MTQAERISMNVWNDIIAMPKNQHRGISYSQLEKVIEKALTQHKQSECNHFFPETKLGYVSCELCGITKETPLCPDRI